MLRLNAWRMGMMAATAALALFLAGCGSSSNSASAQAAAKRKQLLQRRTARITEMHPEQPLSHSSPAPPATDETQTLGQP